MTDCCSMTCSPAWRGLCDWRFVGRAFEAHMVTFRPTRWGFTCQKSVWKRLSPIFGLAAHWQPCDCLGSITVVERGNRTPYNWTVIGFYKPHDRPESLQLCFLLSAESDMLMVPMYIYSQKINILTSPHVAMLFLQSTISVRKIFLEWIFCEKPNRPDFEFIFVASEEPLVEWIYWVEPSIYTPIVARLDVKLTAAILKVVNTVDKRVDFHRKALLTWF